MNGDFIRLPVLRWVATVPPGSGWPWYLSSIGFGSKLSTCDTPPFMNRKMTRLACAGWCSPPDSGGRLCVWASSAAERDARDEARERHHAEAAADAAERLAARHGWCTRCGAIVKLTKMNSFELSRIFT